MNLPSVLSMRWSDVLFAHWAVDPAVVRPRLPEGLSVDTYDGDAYLDVVAFQMENMRPRGAPAPVGWSFPEFNLRTYVQGPEGPGIYFYNLDADARLSVSVARQLFQLPYYRADADITRRDGELDYRSHRVHPGAASAVFDATCRPTGETSTAPDPLTGFLTERYLFYADTGDNLFVGPVDHRPWPLQDADLSVRTNTLFEASDFDTPEDDPLVHYSPGVDVTAELARPVGGGSVLSLSREQRDTLA